MYQQHKQQQQVPGVPANLYNNPQQQGPPPPYSSQPGPNVVVQGQFDPGARFDGIAGTNIPPPPPGVAPNAAQMAMHGQGATIVMTQKKGPSTDGGVYTGID